MARSSRPAHGTNSTRLRQRRCCARCWRHCEWDFQRKSARLCVLEHEMKIKEAARLYPVRDACKILGVSYPALKQWIYKKKIKTVKTPGGHHRIPQSEIDRLLPDAPTRGPFFKRRETFRRISGRN